jgi:hypothetical protein
MPIKNPTGWSNADTKAPTAFSNADTKSGTGWHNGTIINPGSLGLFANDLRMLMSNNGRTLVTAGYYPSGKSTTNWVQVG